MPTFLRKPLGAAQTMRFASKPSFTSRNLNTLPALSKPHIAKPKAAAFPPKKIHSTPSRPAVPKKRRAQLCTSNSDTISVVENTVFFLDEMTDKYEEGDFSVQVWCPNAPDSDDEMDGSSNYDPYLTKRLCCDEEDEVIIEQPTGYPLRKKCKYLGVSWNTQHGKWIAQVGYRGKRYYVGQFHDCRLAAIAIDQFCMELGIPPRNRSILEAQGRANKKVPNPNWQTRGERSVKSSKRRHHRDYDYAW